MKTECLTGVNWCYVIGGLSIFLGVLIAIFGFWIGGKMVVDAHRDHKEER